MDHEKVVDAWYDSHNEIQIDEVEKHGSIRNLFWSSPLLMKYNEHKDTYDP